MPVGQNMPNVLICVAFVEFRRVEFILNASYFLIKGQLAAVHRLPPRLC